MSLKAHLFYNVSQDEIIGFEDIGNEILPLPAKSALVIIHVIALQVIGNFPFAFILLKLHVNPIY